MYHPYYTFTDNPVAPPTPVVDDGQTPAGRSRKRKRRWILEYKGEQYNFETFAELEAQRRVWSEQDRQHAEWDYDLNNPRRGKTQIPAKRAKPPRVIVPVETIREAREYGIRGLQDARPKDGGYFDLLRSISKKIEAAADERVMQERARIQIRQQIIAKKDKEDEDDFMEFLREIGAD